MPRRASRWQRQTWYEAMVIANDGAYLIQWIEFGAPRLDQRYRFERILETVRIAR